MDASGTAAACPAAEPFSFRYGGRAFAGLPAGWTPGPLTTYEEAGGTRTVASCTDPASGLRIEAHRLDHRGVVATDRVLWLEAAGPHDTEVVADLLPIDLAIDLPPGAECRVHLTNGAPSDPSDYEPRVVRLAPGSPVSIDPGDGRSSNGAFPFFKVEIGGETLVLAIGWSGQWSACFAIEDGRVLLRAGMERTHFRLHPGERVRTPRILLLRHPGGPVDAGNAFRRLLRDRYAARRSGADPAPVLFSNTCFTRGGGWLNECTAQNQISLIRAYAPLGLEAVITDAGWFEGGWPAGAGNWTPRRDAYPDGMAPVAAAAREEGMAYGLWFEPERVVAGTALHREHPGWTLTDGSANPRTLLADFGLPEVRDHFLGIVRGFMELPGFRVYRQDFNMSPLPYWRHADAPDRQGIAEMQYIAGLYAYWDRIAAEWPDSLREECASGGRRIDLETVMRFHIHQDSDHWFDNEADQCQVWGLSQYLPNNLFATPIASLDDYAFHSALPTSLCIGWIADDPAFDRERAASLAHAYRNVRPLLTGDWYPLLPASRDRGAWMAMQWHRPDLHAGMAMVYRRPQSQRDTQAVSLCGLQPDALYEVTGDPASPPTVAPGSELMREHTVTLPQPGSSRLIRYRRVEA